MNSDRSKRAERLNVTRHNGDYVPPWVGDPDAEDGRSIVENDAIQAEHSDASDEKRPELPEDPEGLYRGTLPEWD